MMMDVVIFVMDIVIFVTKIVIFVTNIVIFVVNVSMVSEILLRVVTDFVTCVIYVISDVIEIATPVVYRPVVRSNQPLGRVSLNPWIILDLCRMTSNQSGRDRHQMALACAV